MPDLDQTSYLQGLNMLTASVRQLLLVTEIVRIDQLSRTCGQMEALGPILEPTAYMRGGMTNLQDQAALLRAVDMFVTEVRKLDRRQPVRNFEISGGVRGR